MKNILNIKLILIFYALCLSQSFAIKTMRVYVGNTSQLHHVTFNIKVNTTRTEEDTSFTLPQMKQDDAYLNGRNERYIDVVFDETNCDNDFVEINYFYIQPKEIKKGLNVSHALSAMEIMGASKMDFGGNTVRINLRDKVQYQRYYSFFEVSVVHRDSEDTINI